MRGGRVCYWMSAWSRKLGYFKVYLAIVGGILSVEAGQKVLVSALENICFYD